MTAFLITCCNATCAVPAAQKDCFKDDEDIVSSKEGWEPGALNFALGLAMKLRTPIVHGEVTRLLIDLNEMEEKQLSRFTAKIPDGIRERFILRENNKFQHAIQARLRDDSKRNDRIIHLDIHTSAEDEGTIILNYATSGFGETFCDDLKLRLDHPELRVNLGSMEPSGLVKWITAEAKDIPFASVRLSVSQSIFLRSEPMRWETLKQLLIKQIIAAGQGLADS